MGEDRDARIDRALDGYFDARTQTIIGRVVGLLDVDELRDDDALDAHFDAFIARLQARYGRDDTGWLPAAELTLRAEYDRQVGEQRHLLDLLEE